MDNDVLFVDGVIFRVSPVSYHWEFQSCSHRNSDVESQITHTYMYVKALVMIRRPDILFSKLSIMYVGNFDPVNVKFCTK